MMGLLFVMAFAGSIMANNDQLFGQYLPDQQVMSTQTPSNEECVRRIYRDCNYPTVFSDEELENVRQYLNYSFTVLADIKPDKPLCPKLHVRQDWKCLSQQQKNRVIDVWKQMYERGDVQRLTDIHVKYWPAWHKTHEFLPGHRWLVNEFEKVMRGIDPTTTLPYWDPYVYGSQPKRSSVWDTFGHSGNYSNGYSVSDGIYTDWDLIPTVKRHWSNDGTILPWFTPEFVTSTIQTTKTYNEFAKSPLGFHYPPHLNIGGYEGQYSTSEAPYDIFFYLHHSSVEDSINFRWQLQRKEFLTPLSYNIENTRMNALDGKEQTSNIFTDTLTGAPSVTIREIFWVGFGDHCYISDQLVRPINNFWKGIKDPVPTAAKRLPQWVLEKYFPVFNSENYSGISHTLEEVYECNHICQPIPRPTFMGDTEAGRRQFEVFRNGPVVNGSVVEEMEQIYYQMWIDLNQSGYCSPYVTTY